MGTTGAIKTIKSGNSIVLPVTSSHAVLLNETHPDTIPGNTLAAKLGEIDNSLGKKQDKLTTIGDLSIYQSDNSTDYVIQHNNSLGIEVNEKTQLQIFDIDNHGHITNCRNATPEDLAKTGTAFLRFVGNYNPKITYSYGDICVINGYKPSDMSLEDGDFIIMGTTGKWSSWQANITPNIQLNNSNNRIYGTGSRTNIYAPTELGKDGEVLTTTENGLEWKTIHAPTKLGNAGYVLATNSTKNGLEWKPIPTTNVEFNSDGNKLTIGDKTISFTGGTGISVNSEKTGTTTDITVSSLYSYNKRDFTTDNNTISLKNPQEQVKLSAGDGIDISTNTVSVKLDSDSDPYLTVGKSGLKLSGIKTVIDAEEQARTEADTALDTRVDSLEAMVNPINSGYPYIVEEIWGEDHNYNFENLSRIDKLANNTQAVLKELWGENHNYDWSKSSRIDNLESTVNNLSYIQTIKGDSSIQVTPRGKTVNLTFNENKLQELIPRDYEVFGWDLEFGEGLIPMPHENALWITQKTGGYIKLPYPGTYKIKFKGVSPLEVAEQTSKITINGVDLDGFYNGTAIYKELITTSNDGKITIGAEYAGSAIFDISITSSRDRDIKQLTKESISFVTDIQNLWVSSGQNIINEQLNDGFYSFSFKIKGSSPIGLMCWPIIDPSPKEPLIYNGVDQTKNRYFRNNAVKYYNINKSTYTTINSPYYYIPDSSNLLVQTVEPGNYSIKDFTITKLKFVDNIMGNSIINSSTINTSTINTSTINNSIINNPNLILSSGTSKLFSGTNDAGNVCLKYTLGGILKWTLDENGIQMNTDSNLPAEPIEGTVFYYSLNRPTINTKLSNLEKRFLNVFNININTKNGYYINPINTQLGLDYEVHDCYVINNGSQSTINIYVQNDCIIQDPNLVA